MENVHPVHLTPSSVVVVFFLFRHGFFFKVGRLRDNETTEGDCQTPFDLLALKKTNKISKIKSHTNLAQILRINHRYKPRNIVNTA